jgi:adenylate cyclase
LTDSLMAAFEATSYSVDRLNIGVFILHPEFAGVAYQRVYDNDELNIVEVRHSDLTSRAYQKSPIALVVKSQKSKIWETVDMFGSQHDFLRELSLAGFTGYCVIPLRGAHRRTHVFSIATKKEGGFTEDEWDDLNAFSGQLSLLVDSLGVYKLAEVLLGLYLGKETGGRALTGAVQRGQGEIVDSVVLMCDMRDFTQTCASLSGREVIDLLNQFFDRICDPIEQNDGEILKFMGDAVLAIFPTQRRTLEEASRDCVRASRMALKRISTPFKLLGGRVVSVSAGFGLHAGKFHYGNIGTRSRLDFTAIGDAVNLASRIESMCKPLGVDILCSQRFAELAGVSGKNMGMHQIKGFERRVRLIGIDPRLPDESQ